MGTVIQIRKSKHEEKGHRTRRSIVIWYTEIREIGHGYRSGDES